MDQIAKITRGASPRPINEWMSPHGTPWVKISDATRSNTRYIDSTREFIKSEGEKYSAVVEEGDLILSNSATPGLPKFMKIHACIHDGWMLLREIRDAIPEFLYYRLLVDRKEIVGLGNGSVFTNLKTDILKAHKIALPSIEEQQRIAQVFGNLDDLIESNLVLIENLDKIFHLEWLRRFATCQETGTTLLSELATTQYGFTDSATEDQAGPKFLRVADINKRNWIEWNEVPHCSPDARINGKYKLEKGDLLVARMADPGKVARLDEEVDAVFASYLVRVKPLDKHLSLFLYGFLKSIYYKDYSSRSITGSVQKNMNAQIIIGAKLGLPTSDEVLSFNLFAEPLRDQIASLVHENEELMKARDELMPLVLNGILNVRLEV